MFSLPASIEIRQIKNILKKFKTSYFNSLRLYLYLSIINHEFFELAEICQSEEERL